IDICLTIEIGNLRIVVDEEPTMGTESKSYSISYQFNDLIEEKSLSFYFNTLNIQPIINNQDLMNVGINQHPLYSFGVNALLHNEMNNYLINASISFVKPISASNSLNSHNNYTMEIGFGKIMSLSPRIQFYSMLGTGLYLFNNSNLNGQFTPL